MRTPSAPGETTSSAQILDPFGSTVHSESDIVSRLTVVGVSKDRAKPIRTLPLSSEGCFRFVASSSLVESGGKTTLRWGRKPLVLAIKGSIPLLTTKFFPADLGLPEASAMMELAVVVRSFGLAASASLMHAPKAINTPRKLLGKENLVMDLSSGGAQYPFQTAHALRDKVSRQLALSWPNYEQEPAERKVHRL